MSRVRCFVGAQPSERLTDDLTACMERIRSGDSRWCGEKWVDPRNLHLTLHFIGDVETGVIGDLARELGGALAHARSFVLPFDRAEAVPGDHRARMLWARFADPGGACRDLALVIDRALDPHAQPTAQREFKAHVTLCRARKPRSIDPQLLAYASKALTAPHASMSVRSVTLFSSQLTPHGPVYAVIDRWLLRRD